MKKKYVYMLRITGRSAARRYYLERSDHRVWTGKGWVNDQSRARIYRTVADAQDACRRFLARSVRGQSRREFICPLTVTVFGDDDRAVNAEDVAKYLMKVMTINLDYEMLYDGPLAGHHVEVRARLGELADGGQDEGANGCVRYEGD